jgi:hypothetical protein
MILLKPLITEEKVPAISLQQAADADLFGPVYHGAREENLSKIDDEGFKVFVGMQRQAGVSHGYDFDDYYGGIPAPIHHLGFGIYFTTSKSIAIKFAFGNKKIIKRVYYLKVPRLETINFGASRTMMKWWMQNGYDFKPQYDTQDDKYKSHFFGRSEILNANHERLRATINMTNELKSKYDAVWYKGKGIRSLLDGDQVCVYEPEGKIFQIDLKLSRGFEIGSRVVVKHDIVYYNYEGKPYREIPAGLKGIIVKRHDAAASRAANDLYWAKRAEKWDLQVKFEKGGVQSVEDVDVEPLVK